MKKGREKALIGRGIMMSLLIIAGLSIVGIGMASAAPTVSIDPSLIAVAPIDTFSINVSVNPEEYGVMGCKIDLTYNASAFTVTDADITEGELISPKLMTEPGSGIKAPGWIHYGIIRTPADTLVPTDSGTFITVTFSVNSGAIEDIYTLSLSNVTLNNESGVEIPGVEVHDGNIIVDKTPPVIQFIDPTPANESINTTGYINVTVEVTDPTPGSGLEDVVNISVWNEAGIYLDNETMYDFDEHKYYYNVSSLPNGNYTYKVYAKDIVGNMGVSETRVITVNAGVKGDFDGDGNVGWEDLIAFTLAYDTHVGDPNYNVLADFDDDGDVDWEDLIAFTIVYGT
jgi:hypothetical protein